MWGGGDWVLLCSGRGGIIRLHWCSLLRIRGSISMKCQRGLLGGGLLLFLLLPFRRNRQRKFYERTHPRANKLRPVSKRSRKSAACVSRAAAAAAAARDSTLRSLNATKAISSMNQTRDWLESRVPSVNSGNTCTLARRRRGINHHPEGF